MRNATDRPQALRRVPLDETRLAISSTDAGLVAGDVSVVIHSAEQAESTTTPGTPPPGAHPLISPPPDEAGTSGGLSWLLDGTRRSVDFQL